MDLDAQSAPPPSPFLPLHQATIILKVLVDRKGALIAVHVTIEDQVNTIFVKQMLHILLVLHTFSEMSVVALDNELGLASQNFPRQPLFQQIK